MDTTDIKNQKILKWAIQEALAETVIRIKSVDDKQKSVPIEEIEKAYESIMDVAEGGYVDIEEIKVHFCKWLGIEDA